MADAPRIVHRYEIVERLGQGGMGDLYLGRDPMLDRFVAIKMLKAGSTADDLRERFAREAKSAARLAHVNIVTIYDVGEHEGQPYIAMEYVLGETLLEKIRRRSDLPLATKLQYVDELCAGLAHAHKAGIIHRDIKPANLIVAAEGALKILDFGIARLADSSMTQAGMMLGTLNYMSPEQISGPEVDHRSDIFAVGAVFYELLSYQQAFPGAIDTVLSSILYGTPAPISQLCPGLDASIVKIVEKALAKSPDDRFDDLTTMRSDLARARDRMDRKVLAAPVTTSRIRADKIPIAIPTPGGKTPRRGTTREEIKRRRAEELAGHLNAARSLFAAGKFEEASAACERVLIIEQDNDEALDLSERARAAIEQNQIRVWATEARAEVERGNLEGAQGLLSSILSLDADSPEARSLRGSIGQLESRRHADKVVDDGRHSLESGDAAAAAAAAREALRANPTHAGAASLLRDASVLVDAQRRKAEHDRQARDAVITARRQFESGNHEAALAGLEQFSPSHPEVDTAIEELRGELRELRERAYALSQQAAAEVVIAQAWLARDDLVEAEIAVERARLMAPDDPAVAEVARAIDARRAAIDARRQADEEARRQADLARQRADSEARRRTEEEARRKADAARVKAEAEARRQAEEEARRKAEAEERREAEAEEQRRADEEAQLEAARQEEEARRREEDARLKAEADARRAEETRRAEEKRRADEARRAAEARRLEEDRRRDEERRREVAQREAEDAEEAQRQEEAARAAADADERRRVEEAEAAEAESRRRSAESVTEQIDRRALQPGKGKDAKQGGDAAPVTEIARPTEKAATPMPLMSAPPAAARAGAGARQMAPIAAAAIVVLALLAVGVWRFSGGDEPVANNTPTVPQAAPTVPVSPPEPQAAPAPAPSTAPAVTDAAPAPTAPPASAPTPATTSTAETAAVDAMRRQAAQLMQRNDRLQALAVVEKGLRASPSDAQLQQMVTTLLRDAQQSTASAKDEAVKADAPKFADAAFGEGTRLEAEAATKTRASDRPGSIRSLIAATDAFGKATAAARDASAKASAAEALRLREAEEKRQADLAREKQLADAKLEADRKLKEQPRAEPPPPTAALPPKGNAPALPSPAADEEAVRATLKQYEAAYESLDIAAVTRVFPGAQANQLGAAFKQYRSYELEILVESIQFGPQRMRAMVAARVTYVVQPLSGRRMNSTQAQQFLLAREPGGWRIEAIK